MANTFGTDILIQSEDPERAAAFYVNELGFTITGYEPSLISLHGDHINLFRESGPALGFMIGKGTSARSKVPSKTAADACLSRSAVSQGLFP
jgi:hypothetical protein